MRGRKTGYKTDRGAREDREARGARGAREALEAREAPGRRVLVTILTSSQADLSALCYESVAASIAGTGGAWAYTVRVVVNSTNEAHFAAVRAVVPASVAVVRTESNGRPGKGHNSVLETFRRSPEYAYLVMVDGDDFLYPRALARLEAYLAYEPDVLLLAFHDKLAVARTERDRLVPHFSMRDRLVWFYNLTDVTVPMWYRAKSKDPFAHEATELNTPARPLVFSRRSLAFDLAYDETARLYDDFVVCCKCLERSVLGDLRVFGVVDSHVYLYNTTTPGSATSSFGTQHSAEENAAFRAGLRGKFLAIRDWAARLRDLRMLELGQADEPDHLETKYRFVERLAGRMDRLPATVAPCGNALVVAEHARTSSLRRDDAERIEAELVRLHAERCANARPIVAVVVCVRPGDSTALAHTLERTARLVDSVVVAASDDDAVARAIFAYGGAPANARLVRETRLDEGTTVMAVAPTVYVPLDVHALLPARLEPDAVYVATDRDAVCVYVAHREPGPRRVVELNIEVKRIPPFPPSERAAGPGGPEEEGAVGPTGPAAPMAPTGPAGPGGPIGNKKTTTLVVVIGSLRGGEETWRSMYAHLLVPYGADLAILNGAAQQPTDDLASDGHATDGPTVDGPTVNVPLGPSLYRAAKYVWSVPEYANWRDYYTERGVPVDAFVENAAAGFAGGIDEYTGSGAVVCAFRHALLNDHLDVLERYDRVIVTRSDHYYIADHPVLENDGLYIVEGEDYGGGVCDRHWVFPSSMCRAALGILEYMTEDLPRDEAYAAVRGSANVERMLALMLRANGVVPKRHRRVQFTVAAENDKTRWREAKIPFKPEHGLYAKYETEYALAMGPTTSN